MKYAYAVTHKTNGSRVLTRANQGRNHFKTLNDCIKYIEVMKKNNTKETLLMIGIDPESLKATKIKCYDSGDSMQTVFND